MEVYLVLTQQFSRDDNKPPLGSLKSFKDYQEAAKAYEEAIHELAKQNPDWYSTDGKGDQLIENIVNHVPVDQSPDGKELRTYLWELTDVYDGYFHEVDYVEHLRAMVTLYTRTI